MDESRTGVTRARTLVSGALFLFSARLVASALALVQAILLASKFGTSASADAYFVAFAVSHLFTGWIEAALNVAFVPVFVHAAETEGDAMAWRIAAGLFRVGLVGSGVVALLGALLAPWIPLLLAPGFDDAAMAQAAQMIRITAPTIIFVYAAAFLSTLEFIEGRSLLPASGMIVSAAAVPLALVWLADRYGIVSLAWAALAGAVVRCLLLIRLPLLRRLLGPAVPVRDPIMRGIGAMMVSRLLTIWFLDLNLLVDRVFASLLGPGFISALAYASGAVKAVARMFLMPIGRMLMPALGRLAARGSYDRMRGQVEKLMLAMAFLLVPLVAFIVTSRADLLGVVFGGGAFDEAALEATAVALLYYGLGIIPFVMTPLLSGVFFSLQDSATPLRIGMMCVVANVVLDAILMLGLGHGGIALATSLVAGIRALLLWVYLRRRIGALQSRYVLRSLVISGAAAVVAFWSARVVVSLAGPEWSAPAWRLAGYGLIGSAGYLVLQMLFNRPVFRLISAVLGRLNAERS